ncbi:PREDICTED: lipoprotein lipase-like isoform X2 [Papilio polytes]|uniref:lipoprotein lipase-like isoform X2 n=1 Tax=Papilio polytes TaxID=76194 RepID=UPI000675E6DF|nr:PREDICTED: lipoprotein lipase-like isoform X2 [Papilio polytes]
MLAWRRLTYVVFLCGTIECEDDTKDDYGSSWLMLVDEAFNRHVLNFSDLPSRGMRFGKPDFYLYTRNNRDDPEVLFIPKDDNCLKSVYFNGSNDIRVITHGWMSDYQVGWVQSIKDSLLRHYDLNVMTVDWSHLAKNPLYPWSALSAKFVGKQIAKLLDSCTKTYGVGRDRMYLIGHSLGAQAMGYAGRFLDGDVHRITGLDPARPLFELPLLPIEFRLDKSDAHYVDIIHTCAGLFGYEDSYGHADFYPNEGTTDQPGCPAKRELLDSCSHGRAAIYFEESIEYPSGNGFMAYRCDSWKKFKRGLCKENKTTMGYHSSSDSRGDFYLRTNSAPPYAI